jgi:uncharacterized membrane protein YagU involved in acid resistance
MNRKFSAILQGGLIAGVFDICYAIIISYARSEVPPSRLLQSVASGLLGRDAYSGGAATAALGLGLHFFMTLLMAAAYVAGARWLPILHRRPVLCGAIYGAFLYAFMNLVVLPLSRFPPRPAAALVVIVTSLIVHMFLVGVPIALASRRAYASP